MPPQIHLINPLENIAGGSEQRCLHLYDLLRARTEVVLWSNGRTDPTILARYPIRPLLDAGPVPEGGTVVFVGWYRSPGAWIERIRADRTILIFNTPGFGPLREAVELLRRLGLGPELVFPSRWMQQASGFEGRIQESLIDLQRFQPNRAARPHSDRFCVGRLSRDVGGKHHGSDLALYAALARQNIRVRLMGATVLSPFIPPALSDAVEILPTAAEPAERFLQGLDCFYYRTHEHWREPSGRVVAEAMAAGVPVVLHREVGNAEHIIHGENGFLFDTPDQAFQLILALRSDPEMAHCIAIAARETTETMYSAQAVARIAEFYLNPTNGQSMQG